MRTLRILDLVIFVLFVSLVIASSFLVAGKNTGEPYVEVETDSDTYLLPLADNHQLVVNGPVGETHILVEDGSALVTHSDCRDQICMAMGHISDPSAWIACLPNRVFLRVIGGGDDEDKGVDAGAF